MNKRTEDFNALMDIRSLAQAASNSGMKMPDNPESYSAYEYPHFAMYVMAQMCRKIPNEHPSAHWYNARLISTFSEDAILGTSLADLELLLQ